MQPISTEHLICTVGPFAGTHKFKVLTFHSYEYAGTRLLSRLVYFVPGGADVNRPVLIHNVFYLQRPVRRNRYPVIGKVQRPSFEIPGNVRLRPTPDLAGEFEVGPSNQILRATHWLHLREC